MRAKRIQNPELVQEILTEVYEQVAEDNSPHPRDIPLEVLERAVVIALKGDTGIHGIIALSIFSLNISKISLTIRAEYHGNAQNIELARMGVQQCSILTGHPKLIMMIPMEDKEQLRFAQRVGFRREGIIRSSFLRKGKLIDQYLVGITV